MRQILLFAIFGAITISCSNDENSIQYSINDEISQEKAPEIYANMEESFRGTTRGSDHITYPDYYGGSYINDDGELVIMTTDGTETIQNDITSRTKSVDFKIKTCEYSFNELQDLNIQISEKFNNRKLVNELKWVAVGLDIKENKVCISLEDCSEQNINKFKEHVSDSPMLKFETMAPIDCGPEIIPEERLSIIPQATAKTNIHLGSGFNTKGQVSSNDNTPAIFMGSVGCRAMKGSEHGFVTAAHCAPKVGMVIYRGSTNTQIGKVTNVKLNTRSDAAFVTIDYEQYYPTNCTYRSITPLHDAILANSSLVGYEVSTEGQATTEVVKSKVKQINASTYINEWTSGGQVNYKASDIVLADFTSSRTQHGDSGGIVYTRFNVVGIHCGSSGRTTQIFSSAEYALKDLGLTNIWEK